jgi:phosphotransferase system enzyme I (PtsI)
MLLDPEYQERIELHISEEGVSPAYAVERATQFYREMFEQMDNAYFRERAADLVDIGDRLIATILGEGESERPDSAYILVTDFLKPSDLIGDVSEHLLGVCSGA